MFILNVSLYKINEKLLNFQNEPKKKKKINWEIISICRSHNFSQIFFLHVFRLPTKIIIIKLNRFQNQTFIKLPILRARHKILGTISQRQIICRFRQSSRKIDCNPLSAITMNKILFKNDFFYYFSSFSSGTEIRPVQAYV